jgi:hypothetical protein
LYINRILKVAVENTLENTWSLFKDTIKVFPQLANDLNRGCQQSDITAIGKKMGTVLPDALKRLYVLNNGQRGEADGIFKAVSGYSKFSKVFFLPLDKILAVWQYLRADKPIDVFRPNDIPFAADRCVTQQNIHSMDDVFCMDSETGEVFLLWTAFPDPFLPPDWQTNRIKQAENLIDFLHKQIGLY